MSRLSARRLPVRAKLALVVICVLTIVAVFGPLWISDPNAGDTSQRLLPVGSPGHPWGTDGQGRDILDRIIAGARPTLLSGLVPVVVAASLGTVLGVAAGMGTRFVHGTIMRTLDVFYAFPAVLLAIAIASALGPGISNSIIALAIVLVPPVARVAETETRRQVELDYMVAARASGATATAIAVRQVLPNVAPPVVVYSTALIGLSIVFAAGLSFLGLGVVPPTAEWGVMLNEHTQYMYSAPVLALIPAAMILAASAAFNILGDGLRDLLDIKGETR